MNTKLLIIILLSTTSLVNGMIPLRTTKIDPIIQQNIQSLFNKTDALHIVLSPHSINLQEQFFINDPCVKKSAHTFLDTLFSLSFDKIGHTFRQLPHLAQLRVLGECGKIAQPIIMFATRLSRNERRYFIKHILDKDLKAADMFCSLPLHISLKHYAKTQQNLESYHESLKANLPLGYHFRITDKERNILSNSVNATSSNYSLTEEEMKQLCTITKQDPWILEALQINSKFLYQRPTLKEKCSAMKSSLSNINWYGISIIEGGMLAIFNSPILTGLPLTIPYCIYSAISSYHLGEFRKLIDMIIRRNKASLSVNLVVFVLYIANNFKNNYQNQISILLESKKQYLTWHKATKIQ